MIRRRSIYTGAQDEEVDIVSLIPNYSENIATYAADPKYFIFGFVTTSDNVTITINYGVNYTYMTNLRLDGSTTGCNNPYSGIKATVTVAEAGIHFITFYFKTQVAANANKTLQVPVNCFYVRFGNNVAEMLNGKNIFPNDNSVKWNIIDVLDENYVAAIKSNSNSVYSKADTLRVPKGSKILYVNNSVPTDVLNKMTEIKYKITT